PRCASSGPRACQSKARALGRDGVALVRRPPRERRGGGGGSGARGARGLPRAPRRAVRHHTLGRVGGDRPRSRAALPRTAVAAPGAHGRRAGKPPLLLGLVLLARNSSALPARPAAAGIERARIARGDATRAAARVRAPRGGRE